MRRRNDGAGVSPQEEFGDVCFHALGIIDQNREYLQMHLLASADLPTRQALSDIQIESARLDRTVRNAITLYQLENEELSELQPLDLCGLLEKAGRLAPDIQRSLEITLTAESGGIEHCAVMGVPDEAEQLLLHLISNALRACDAGGRVWVSLKQKKTGVALRVEDNGCGLMEEDPIENNRRFLSGAKLGLRICKLICRRAGWKLTLTARPGGGTRAQVVFPLASCEDIPPEWNSTPTRRTTSAQRGSQAGRHRRSFCCGDIERDKKASVMRPGRRSADAFALCAGQGREQKN